MRRVVAAVWLLLAFVSPAPSWALEETFSTDKNINTKRMRNAAAPQADSDLVRILDTPKAVANIAALEALTGALYHDGVVVRVQSMQRDFVYHATSSATVDHLTVASASGAAGARWVSSFTPTLYWWSPTAWWVDPANVSATASDQNNGTTSVTALRTWGELGRRLNGAMLPSGTVTVTLLSDTPASDPLYIRNVTSAGFTTFKIVGTTSVVATRTMSTPRNPAITANDHYEITDATTFTSWITNCNLLHKTTATEAWGWPYKDLGGNKLQTSAWVNTAGGSIVTLTNGHAYEVLDLPDFADLIVEGPSVWVGFEITKVRHIGAATFGAATIGAAFVVFDRAVFPNPFSIALSAGDFSYPTLRNVCFPASAAGTQVNGRWSIIGGLLVGNGTTDALTFTEGFSLGGGNVPFTLGGVRMDITHDARFEKLQVMVYDWTGALSAINVSHNAYALITGLGGERNTGNLVSVDTNASAFTTDGFTTWNSAITTDGTPYVVGGNQYGSASLGIDTNQMATKGMGIVDYAGAWGGDLTGVGINPSVANNAVSNAKLRDSGALSVIGRNVNTGGDPADIPASAGSDAVLRESGSTIAWGTVATAGIANDAVTLAKITNFITDSFPCRDTAGTGDLEVCAVGGGVEFTGGPGIQRSALTGAITATAGSNTTAFGVLAATSVLANATGSSAVPAALAASADGQFLGRAGGVLTWTAAIPGSSVSLTATQIAYGSVGNTMTSEAAFAYNATTNTLSVDGTIQQKFPVGNVKAFGALGDGSTDDTTAVQAALNASTNVYFPAGTYVVSNVTVTTDGTRIFGDGVLSVLLMKAGAVNAMVTSTNQRITIENLALDGGIASTMKATCTPPANRSGIFINLENDVRLLNLTIHGFGTDALAHLGGGGTRASNAVIQNVTAYNNWLGIGLDGNGAEYVRVSNVDIHNNCYGVSIKAGNITVSNSKINDNAYGVYLYGTGNGNNGHGNVTGSLINHNTTNFFCEDVTIGYNVIANNMFEGPVSLKNCTGIHIEGGILDVTDYYFDGGGINYIRNNYIQNGWPNTLHHNFNAHADSTLMIDNFTPGGTFVDNNRNLFSAATVAAGSLTYGSGASNGNQLASSANLTYSGGVLSVVGLGTPGGYVKAATTTGATSSVASIPASDVTGLFYQTIQNAGSGLTQRTRWNASTGLTAVDNGGSTRTDVTANLSTGISGGQTAIGGTGASENLTLSSTISGTKGKTIFGSTTGMVYDEAAGVLSVGIAIPAAVTIEHLKRNTNTGVNLLLENNSAGNAAYVGITYGTSDTIFSGPYFGTWLYGTGFTTSGQVTAGTGQFQISGGTGNMLFDITQTSGDWFWRGSTSNTVRMQLTNAGVLSVANLNTGIVRADSDVLSAPAIPGSFRVLVGNSGGTDFAASDEVLIDTGTDHLLITQDGAWAHRNVGGVGATNYEEVISFWSGNIWNLKSQKGGTGVVRDMVIDANTAVLMLDGGEVDVATLASGGYVVATVGSGKLTVAGAPWTTVFAYGNANNGVALPPLRGGASPNFWMRPDTFYNSGTDTLDFATQDEVWEYPSPDTFTTADIRVRIYQCGITESAGDNDFTFTVTKNGSDTGSEVTAECSDAPTETNTDYNDSAAVALSPGDRVGVRAHVTDSGTYSSGALRATVTLRMR